MRPRPCEALAALMPTLISSILYDLWCRPTEITYGSGTYEKMTCSNTRGWVTGMRTFNLDTSTSLATPALYWSSNYTRFANGRAALMM